jgi:transcriptional regulator with GAF, ATPase, and Fis domain
MDGWKTQVLGSEETLRIPGFQLKVVRGPDKGTTFAATAAEVNVGSAERNELRLSDPAVSRSHFSIEARPDGFRLRDLGSTNGTFVGGVRIADAVVPSGVEIEVGESRLRLIEKGDEVELVLHKGDRFGSLIGRSTIMRQLFARLDRAARSEGTILILGETGTGKDLAAEAIHLASPRSAGPFVVVDCGAIPATLMESELFGHERGAFTGAVGRRMGAFESANGGTLFLDEIGELPLELQPKLLRVLEKKTVKPVGSEAQKPVDIRVIAATHRDLRREVNRGTFREDLFFRLSVIPVRMPPLRERESDALLLAEAFFRERTPEGTPLPVELKQRIAQYEWPGNVSELRNAVEQVAALGEFAAETSSEAPSDGAITPFKEAKKLVIEHFEKPYLEKLLQHTSNNVIAAARVAGLDRVHLLKLLRQYGLR